MPCAGHPHAEVRGKTISCSYGKSGAGHDHDATLASRPIILAHLLEDRKLTSDVKIVSPGA